MENQINNGNISSLKLWESLSILNMFFSHMALSSQWGTPAQIHSELSVARLKNTAVESGDVGLIPLPASFLACLSDL